MRSKLTKLEFLKDKAEKVFSETMNVDNFSTNSINTNSDVEPVYSREVFPEYSDREKTIGKARERKIRRFCR